MKQNYRIVVFLFLVTGMSVLMGQSSLGHAKANGMFITNYPPVNSPEHEIMRSGLEKLKLLEQFANGMNNLVAIPGIVSIELRECGKINAFYRPVNGRLAEIVMCYEMLDDIKQVLSYYYPDPQMMSQMVAGAMMFVLLHELGHALVHQLDLPITGKEEDAVDQLSTLMLTNAGATGEGAIMAGAQYFKLGSAQYRRPGMAWLENVFGIEHYNFSDEHSIHEQRFFNILCWEYGYNPEALAFAVKDGTLPAHRAERCGQEYQQIVRTWERFLAPHAKVTPPLFKVH
jgi:hypothetical protein